jgi:hypothetical protein
MEYTIFKVALFAVLRRSLASKFICYGYTEWPKSQLTKRKVCEQNCLITCLHTSFLSCLLTDFWATLYARCKAGRIIAASPLVMNYFVCCHAFTISTDVFKVSLEILKKLYFILSRLTFSYTRSRSF